MFAKLHVYTPRLTTGLGAGLLMFTMACQTPSGSQIPIPLPQPTATIESLREPERVKRSVTLTGAVTQRLAIVNGWLYQINDGTGEIWIATQQTAPAISSQVRVKGILRYQPIEINSVDLGDYYLDEENWVTTNQ
ncbi:MAG: hypothetical protein AAF821_16295 [Cyanobacteria bacterium P01_D01_bin.156]